MCIRDRPGADIKELADGTTTVKWTGLEATDKDGKAYVFSVREVDEEGNDFTPENYSKVENGLTVTNTYVIPTDGEAEATKVWTNGPTPRPTVWFKLYRQIEGGDPVEVPGAEIKELADGTLTVKWAGLEATDKDGKAYVFSVLEVDADGNDFTPENYTKVENGLTVTNTYKIPTDGEVKATKVWVNGPTPRPTVWFKPVSYTHLNVHMLTIRILLNNNWFTYSTGHYKYGQSTEPDYNAAINAYNNYLLYISPESNIAYSEAPKMPDSDLTIYGRYAGSQEYTIHYVEKATGNQIHPDFKFFGPRGLYFTIEDGIDIPGFTVRPLSEWLPLGNDRIGTIYYDRNKYDITFNYNDGIRVVTRPNIPYEANISGQAPNDMIPGVTTILFNGVRHTFEGWYDNQGFGGSPYDFTGKTMPAHNLNFYAKWTPEKHTVKFHKNQNVGSEVIETVEVANGSTVSQSDAPSVEQENFLGWYTYIGESFVKYDFSTAVQSDLDLYPVWASDDFRVTYNLNGGSGTAPVDLNKYLVNSEAVVLPIPAGAAPTGKVFLGWKIGNTGQMYHPNDKLTITDNIVLVAQWGNLNESTKIVYNGNGGLHNGSDRIERTVPNNVNHTIEGNVFVRDSFIFVGWNTKADGSGNSYQPGENIMIDKINEDTENILYAMWVESKTCLLYTSRCV